MTRDLNFLKDFRHNKESYYEIPDFANADLSSCPAKPGVYIIVSQKDKFIYPKGESVG